MSEQSSDNRTQNRPEKHTDDDRLSGALKGMPVFSALMVAACDFRWNRRSLPWDRGNA
jgi:hypothetical protein